MDDQTDSGLVSDRLSDEYEHGGVSPGQWGNLGSVSGNAVRVFSAGKIPRESHNVGQQIKSFSTWNWFSTRGRGYRYVTIKGDRNDSSTACVFTPHGGGSPRWPTVVAPMHDDGVLSQSESRSRLATTRPDHGAAVGDARRRK